MAVYGIAWIDIREEDKHCESRNELNRYLNNDGRIIACEGSEIEINGEILSVTFDKDNVIVNGEQVGVSESTSGDAASAVVEAKSVEVIGEAVSVIFDDSTAIVNEEVVRRSREI